MSLITYSNIQSYWNSILECVRESSFISIDTEFSGWGIDKGITDTNLEDRYIALTRLAGTHAIFSLGLAVFKEVDVNTYISHNFTFLLRCTDEFQCTPKSMKFLAEHGLDFNLLFQDGIPFTPRDAHQLPNPRQNTNNGEKNIQQDDKEKIKENNEKEPVGTRIPSSLDSKNKIISLFYEIRRLAIPIVLHNGFMDLLFLYHSFVSALPPTLSQFVSDVNNEFPNVYDTKFITYTYKKEKATFLDYLFCKCRRKNEKNRSSGNKAISIHNWNLEIPIMPKLPKPLPTTICPHFANRGFCNYGVDCLYSHDIEFILDQEEIERKIKQNKALEKKRKKAQGGPKSKKAKLRTSKEVLIKEVEIEEKVFNETDQVIAEIVQTNIEMEQITENITPHNFIPQTNQTVDSENNLNKSSLATNESEGRHNAGYDAYATGYIFCYYKLQLQEDQIIACKNKLYIGGKSFPLVLYQSIYQ